MLDRLTVRDGTILDTSGRSVVLRGFVTLTGDQRGPVELTEANFDQIAGWGMNVQQIRLEGCRMGILECDPDPAYLDKLDRWVSWAARRGIYSIFKMTTYDVPSLGVGKAFDRGVWQRLWDSSEQRADRIEAWRRAWERFKGRPEIVGYDILNEPSFGTGTPEQTGDALYGFYEDVGTALREVDSEALLIVQPVAGMGMLAQAMGLTLRTPHGDQARISDPLCVFAPHFYPDIAKECTEQDYSHELDGFVEEGRQVGGALLIGEYGLPNTPFPLGQRRIRAWNEREERLKGAIFDRHGVGNIRPWYVDEGFWAVCGPGFEETERVAAVVRPFPQRVGGRALEWSFDYDTRAFACTLEIDANVAAATVIAVQSSRLHAAGSSVEVDGSGSDLRIEGDRLLIPSGTLSGGRHEVVVCGKES